MRLRDIWPWRREEFRWRVLGKRYKVILTGEAKRQLDELPEERRTKVIEEMDCIVRNPYSGDREEFEEEEAEK